MRILLVGVNHRSCPIEVRERLAFRTEQLPEAYAALRRDAGLAESLILSTCNRVEIYAGVPRLDGTHERLSAFLSAHGGFQDAELRSHLYACADPQSVEHLFAVASGLDSMVLGETEILHQVKHAYEQARSHGTAGKALNVLFQKALNAAKTVQTKTVLGRGCVSVGTVALEFAQKIFGDLRPHTVALLGAGKIGEVTLKRLSARGVSNIRVLNRSPERAQRLASSYGGTAYGLGALEAQLLEADILITSASAPGYLLTRAQAAAAMPQRRHRPLCLIDLGVPRNIEPAAGTLENVYLFDIDDLQGLVAHHASLRQQAVQDSQVIIQQKVRHFLAWWDAEGAACGSGSSSALAAAP
ncbi:MAG: glutamyl-tRNA reductase [Candidatus Omnitrophica bacterium]|nr:glutamyl-tRNA reductase [Candidatus Omnitrophota bacterium]